MRKELIFAIILGGCLGLIIAFGAVRINSTLKTDRESSAKNATPTPKTDNAALAIAVAKPDSGAVITTDTVEFAGISPKNSLVVISAEDNDYAFYSDNTGEFTENAALTAGLNEIPVVVFDQNGNSASQKITVVYSSEFAKLMTPPPTPTPPASTQSAAPVQNATESVNAKVAQKVETIVKSPKAYIGVATDIMDTTIQLKNDSGEIDQISTDDATIYIKIGATANKEIKRADVAIGDFIVAMGFVNGKSVLAAKRVLVNSIPQATKRQIIFGKIVSVTKKMLDIKILPAGDDLAATMAKNVSLTSLTGNKSAKIGLTDLAKDDTVVIIGSDKDSSFEVRSVFQIGSPTSPTPSPKPSTKP